MIQLDHSGKISLYHQLYEILHEKLINQNWNPGDMLPPENEFIEQYNVSRITVRRVLDMLVKEGLVYRQRGRGTFVSHPSLEQGLSRIINFTEDMRQRGFEASTRVIFSGLEPANRYISENLRISEGEELAKLERLRLADGEPMCFERSHLVHKFFPGILQYDFSKLSLRNCKTEKYGIRWSRATQMIKASVPPAEIAVWLSMKRGHPVLFIERVSFSQNNVPMEFLQTFYRADRYILYNELQGGAG